MNPKNQKEEANNKNGIYDAGIEKGASRLTPEKIRKVFDALVEAEGGARLRAYTNACVHCGLCSDACHHFLSKDGDPRLSPAGKVKQTISRILNKKTKLDVDFVKQACETVFTECNLCRRCVIYCPFGIDVAYLMLFVRRGCHKLGVVPQYIQDTAHSHASTFNQMWVRDDEWIDTLQWQEEEARDEIPDLRIPIDKKGADIFYSLIGPEPKFRAQLIYQMAVIFHMAGADWTVPSAPGWDNSDMCMFTGDMEMTARLKKVHFEAATDLKAKRIVMGECGHAFRSVYDVGNRTLGWKMPPLPMVHAIEFYAEILREKRIEIPKKFDRPVAFHDPCNIVRGRGLGEEARYVINETCSTFIELTPNREHNFCCGAGGGVINCGPPFKNKRVESNRVKADQLAAARDKGAEVLIAPCHNCHGGLEDIIDHYELGLELKFLGDIIYECMKKE
ncbi:MAG: (Fe-S)-binding protein [Desulfobacteraceae bacterium]|nr:(Fe-S)-binding protein [Desulfobacteraceae bacterium]